MNVTQFTGDVRRWYCEYCDAERLHGGEPSVRGFLAVVAPIAKAMHAEMRE
jgi:hypothetical protein